MGLEKLKEFRELFGFSTQDMATKLKISKPYYWQLENGMRRLYYDLAVRIAGIFNEKPDVIFFEDLSR